VTLRNAILVVLLTAGAVRAAGPNDAWWPAEVERALAKAGDNRPELEKALAAAPTGQRIGMAFLIANMPDSDLRALKADFLLTNAALAYQARGEVPWGKDIPEELFLNDVLPYVNIDEKRDAWRKEFYDLCMPIAKTCKTPSEVARKLNAELFKKVNLRYSTERKAPNQSPKESIEQGKASCTGLSIVLSDACRAVSIPARLAGTPLWSDKRGNHTWVEIWDKEWHFTGACEPDPAGLDRGWFVGAAAQAQKDSFAHAIYAASFKRTTIHFPLVWAMNRKDVPAENVTDRYAKTSAPEAKKAEPSSVLKALQAELADKKFSLSDMATKEFASVPLSKADAETARKLLWEAHAERIRRDRADEIKERVLKEGKLEMPFAYRKFGEKPAGGRSLWISLHGGGGAPKAVNDSQYENQKRLYTVDEGIYLAPRAPTNTWNLWHEEHIDRMFGRLIEDLIVLEDVNPERVYVLGYSAGGDGVYQLAPRMADYWAGAAMMAGHPNGVSLLSLRNVPFALQVGANDAAYNRNKVAKEYGDKLAKLHEDDPKGYENFIKIHEGKKHWMDLEDKTALPWLAKFTRNSTPDRVVWKQGRVPPGRSYWLALPTSHKSADSLVIAERNAQSVRITTAEKTPTLLVRFDDRMVDLDRPVTVTFAGKTVYAGTPPRTIATLCKTLEGRGDPKLMFDAEVSVDLRAGKE
jgi:Transglutaminase-like superfamily